MRVLLLGAGGQVGTEVAALADAAFHVVGYGRSQLDIGDAAAVARRLDEARPDIVVNCAAYTAVDRAEEEPRTAKRVNADAVGALGSICAERRLPVIHLSTDYVFDGSASRPYREDDTPRPLGVYGATKLAGEVALRQATERHVILRLAWVFGRLGRSFVDTILRLARQRPELTVVDDQLGAPTPAVAVATTIKRIAAAATAPDAPAHTWGTFHFAATPTLSWCAFAQAIVDGAMATGLLATASRVRPIATADWPAAAPRPLNSRLDGGKLQRVYRIAAADWQPHLAAYLASLASGGEPGAPKRSAT